MYKSRFVDFYNFIKPQIKHKHTIILQNICDLLSGKLPYIYKSNGKISVIKSIMQGVGFCEMIVRRLIPEWVSMYNDYLIENPITYDIEPIKVIETKDNRKILPEKCWYNEQGNIVRSIVYNVSPGKWASDPPGCWRAVEVLIEGRSHALARQGTP